MGDVWLIVGCLGGFGVVYAIVLAILAYKTEVTPRPELKKVERK